MFDRMKVVGIERDVITYNAVGKSCERAGQFKLAFEVRMQAAQAKQEIA